MRQGMSLLLRRRRCLRIDTSTASVEVQSLAAPRAPSQSRINESRRNVRRTFVKATYRIAHSCVEKIVILGVGGKFSRKAQLRGMAEQMLHNAQYEK